MHCCVCAVYVYWLVNSHFDPATPLILLARSFFHNIVHETVTNANASFFGGIDLNRPVIFVVLFISLQLDEITAFCSLAMAQLV